MRKLIAGLAAFCALLGTASAQVTIPAHFKFTGVVQQAVFDPSSPYGPIVPGMTFSGSYYFDISAPDDIADPDVGSYTTPWPFGSMNLNLGNFHFVADDFSNIGIVNNPGGPDQYTVYAQRGTPGSGLYWTMTLHLEGPATALASDDNPTVPPDLSLFYIRNLTFEGTVIGENAALTQFEIMGTVGTLQVPEPGTILLLGIGLAALAFTRRQVWPARATRGGAACCGVALALLAAPGDAPGFPVTISQPGSCP